MAEITCEIKVTTCIHTHMHKYTRKKTYVCDHAYVAHSNRPTPPNTCWVAWFWSWAPASIFLIFSFSCTSCFGADWIYIYIFIYIYIYLYVTHICHLCICIHLWYMHTVALRLGPVENGAVDCPLNIYIYIFIFVYVAHMSYMYVNMHQICTQLH